MINKDSVIVFSGQDWTVPKFAEKFTEGDEDFAVQVIEKLIHKGSAFEKLEVSKEQKVFQKFTKEDEIVAAAEEYLQIEEDNKDYQARKKRENRTTYGQVEYDFTNILAAKEFQAKAIKSLRLTDTEISIRDGAIVFVCRGITDYEMNWLDRNYTAMNVINNAVGMIDTIASGTTDAVNYGATKIVAPVVQVGAKASASIFKTLLSTTAKVTGSLVSATVNGVKEAGTEIMYDAEVLKAQKDLIEAKDAVKRKVAGFGSGAGMGGGRIVR